MCLPAACARKEWQVSVVDFESEQVAFVPLLTTVSMIIKGVDGNLAGLEALPKIRNPYAQTKANLAVAVVVVDETRCGSVPRSQNRIS